MAWATNLTDRFAVARAIADAILYEGYVLYPYRASAQKNQLRWQFGVLAPPAWVAADPSERNAVRTECLLAPLAPWDEAVEQVVDVPTQALSPLVTASRVEQYRFPPADEREAARNSAGEVVAHIVRRREPVDGRITVGLAPADDYSGLLKVVVTVENSTSTAAAGNRDAMLRQSLVGLHTILAVDDGCFISLLDPPPHARPAAARCRNDGTYPVLVGPDDDIVLSSPIVLYDHPTIAAESPGGLFDATEVDEILALRVLTLTDDEKAEARATDPRAAAVVDRVEAMPPELWSRLHGAVRPVDPRTDSVRVEGGRVRLRPTRRGDALLRTRRGGTPRRRKADDDVTRRVLVAGIGNIFLGDDGFGVEVAARLAGRPLPEGVRAADFGIRGIHLAYELLDGYDALVLIDAMPLGEPPGTLAVVEPDELTLPQPDDEVSTVFDAPTMSPGVVLGLLEMLDAPVRRIVVVGCQPLSCEGIGLSAPVEEAVEVAVDLLADVLNDICAPSPVAPAVSEAPG